MTEEDIRKIVGLVDNHIMHCAVNLASVNNSEIGSRAERDIVAYMGFRAGLNFVLSSNYTPEEVNMALEEDVNLVEIYARSGLK